MCVCVCVCVRVCCVRESVYSPWCRYIFEEGKKARLQEIGPRFTLKLYSLQNGVYDPKHGEFEWKWRVRQLERQRQAGLFLLSCYVWAQFFA